MKQETVSCNCKACGHEQSVSLPDKSTEIGGVAASRWRCDECGEYQTLIRTREEDRTLEGIREKLQRQWREDRERPPVARERSRDYGWDR